MQFNGGSSADSANTGRVIYQLPIGGLIDFNDSTTASNAQFTLTTNAEVDFFQNSNAANSQLTLDASYLGIQDNATTANAIVIATNNSQVDYSNSSTGGATSITLTNNSELTLGEFNGPVTSLTLGSLTTDATSTVDLYGAAFTLNYNGTTPITIAGVLSDVGGGSKSLGSTFTTSGIGTVVLSGANTYSGLTTVGAGNLVLNGSVFGDALVNLGAILSGTGTIGVVQQSMAALLQEIVLGH